MSDLQNPNMVPNRLDQRRVAGLAEASLTVALLIAGSMSASAETAFESQLPHVTQESVRCWPRGEHIVLRASVDPPEEVQKASLYFRWEDHPDWYFVPMSQSSPGQWRAILPKTAEQTTDAVYFVETLSPSFVATRGPQNHVPVIPAEQCREKDPSIIVFSGDPQTTVGATRLGAPVPPGFQSSGIGHFISPTGLTTGASPGGGMSGKTIALIGGGGAGAAAAFLFGGNSGGSPTTSVGGPIGGGPTSTLTTTPAGGGGTTSAPTTTTVGGGTPTSTTTTVSGSGGSTTSSVPGGGTTTTGGGSSTTTSTPGGTTTTTTSGSSTTTTAGSSTTTTSVPTTTTTSVTTTTTTTTGGNANLSLSKSDSPDPVTVGAPNELTYTLTVTNNGPGTATNVLLRDPLPSSVLKLLSTGGCSGSTLVLCSFGTMNSGESRTVQIIVRPQQVGPITNVATVFWNTPSDPAPQSKSATANTMVVSSLKVTPTDRIEFRYRSTLGVDPPDGRVRGRIVVNQTAAQAVDNTGPHVYHATGVAGENYIEAFLEPGSQAEGFWRFDFSGAPNFRAGSLRVESGPVLSLGTYTISFALGSNGEPLRFRYELGGARRERAPR